MDESVGRALAQSGIIDITTTGRRSGEPRRIEIGLSRHRRAIYISGQPRADRKRAWLFNLEPTRSSPSTSRAQSRPICPQPPASSRRNRASRRPRARRPSLEAHGPRGDGGSQSAGSRSRSGRVHRCNAKWLILTSVSLGSLMATLDGSIVNIALPVMGSDFRIDLTTVSWVVVAYLLVIGSLLLPFGRLGELLTFKRVYLTGFAIFTLASVCCGASPNIAALVAFRVLQGIGAAMIMGHGPGDRGPHVPGGRARPRPGTQRRQRGHRSQPGAGSRRHLTRRQRGGRSSSSTPRSGCSRSSGPRILPAETPGKDQKFDVRGAALSGLSLFALLLALSEGQQWGWTGPVILGLVVAFVALGAAFIMTERRGGVPDDRPRAFRSRLSPPVWPASWSPLPGLFTATFLLPVFLEQGSGFSPIEAGLLLTPVPITMALVAPLSGIAFRPFGARDGRRVRGWRSWSRSAEPYRAAGPLRHPGPCLAACSAGHRQGMFMSPNSSAVAWGPCRGLVSAPRPGRWPRCGSTARLSASPSAAQSWPRGCNPPG